MVSIPHLKADVRIFMAYGTPIRTYTSHHTMTTESMNQILSEEYIIDRAKNCWDGPAFLSYTTRMARNTKYVNWTHTCSNLSPAALCDARFFHSAKRRPPIFYTIILLNYPRPYTFPSDLQVEAMTAYVSTVAGHRFWQLTDDA
jgi:hypothetical protein